jgi:hypothetical protein
MPGVDLAAIRRLVETICTDPDVRLIISDDRTVRPVWPARFESLPHPTKVCQAAVTVCAEDGAPFNVSLCDVRSYRQPVRLPVPSAA